MLQFGDFILEETPPYTEAALLEDFDLLREQFKDTLRGSDGILTQLPSGSNDRPLTLGWILKVGEPIDPLNVTHGKET